jgi:hypothetical protein
LRLAVYEGDVCGDAPRLDRALARDLLASSGVAKPREPERGSAAVLIPEHPTLESLGDSSRA